MSNSTSNRRATFSVAPPEFIFRVFYDPESKKCISKNDSNDESSLPFIEVDYATYISIDICDNFTVLSGKIVKNKRRSKYKKIEKIANGKFKTIKNNMIFVVSDNYNGTIDTWNYYNNE